MFYIACEFIGDFIGDSSHLFLFMFGPDPSDRICGGYMQLQGQMMIKVMPKSIEKM